MTEQQRNFYRNEQMFALHKTKPKPINICRWIAVASLVTGVLSVVYYILVAR